MKRTADWGGPIVCLLVLAVTWPFVLVLGALWIASRIWERFKPEWMR